MAGPVSRVRARAVAHQDDAPAVDAEFVAAIEDRAERRGDVLCLLLHRRLGNEAVQQGRVGRLRQLRLILGAGWSRRR